MAEIELGNIFYNIMAKDLSKAGLQAAKGNIAAAGLAAGAAITLGAGAAVMAIDKNNQFMGSIEATALATGIQAGALRDLSLGLSSADDSLGEVNSTMAALGKYGVDNAESMKKVADAALNLADANNTTGDAIANSVIPALQAYGMGADDLASKSDSLTAITHSTRYSIGEVSNILTRTGPEAQAAGLSFDDMATMVEALGLKGVPARLAVTEINTAIKDASKNTADGSVSMSDLATQLGLTSDQMNTATGKITDGAGATQKYSDIAETHVGLMAGLGNTLDKLTIQVGGALAPYSGLFAGITAGGGVLTAASGALTLYNSLQSAGTLGAIAKGVAETGAAVATGVVTAAQWLLNAAMSANPIGIIILALAGLVAVIVLLDQKFHFIQPTIDTISRGFGIMAGLVGDLINIYISNLMTSFQILGDFLSNTLGGAIDFAMDGFNRFMGILRDIYNFVSGLLGKLDDLKNGISNIGGGVGSFVGGIGSFLGFAGGGDVTGGQPILVGEQGPELWVPPSSGTIIPNGMMGRGQEITINLPAQDIILDHQVLGTLMGRTVRITTGVR